MSREDKKKRASTMGFGRSRGKVRKRRGKSYCSARKQRSTRVIVRDPEKVKQPVQEQDRREKEQ